MILTNEDVMTTENQFSDTETTIEIQPYTKTNHKMGASHIRSLKAPNVTKTMKALSLRPTKSIKRKESFKPTKKA